MAFNVPEHYRITTGPQASSLSDGNNGFFIVPARGTKSEVYFQVIASDCRHPTHNEFLQMLKKEHDGIFWEHVSISIIHMNKHGETFHTNRCPTWEEMCIVKSLFWEDPEDVVIQFHPAESQYVNNHPFVLHLWRAVDVDNNPRPLDRPLKEMVGLLPSKKKTEELKP